jgi:hypothetical protein
MCDRSEVWQMLKNRQHTCYFEVDSIAGKYDKALRDSNVHFESYHWNSGQDVVLLHLMLKFLQIFGRQECVHAGRKLLPDA